MSRPIGPEGDLGRMLGRIHSLREQRAQARGTREQYRTTITNYKDSLLTMCSQPDIQTLLERSQAHGEGLFPPRVGFGNSSMFNPHDNPNNSWLFFNPDDHIAVTLEIGEIAKRKSGFLLRFDIDLERVTQHYDWIEQRRHRERLLTMDAYPSQLNNLLALDTKSKWKRYKLKDHDYTIFTKPITTEDFMRHPEWLELFERSLSDCIDRAHTQTTSLMQAQQKRIEQFITPPIGQVVADLRMHTRNYSSVDLIRVSQVAAGTILEDTPPIPAAVSEKVKGLIAQMVTERLAGLQLEVTSQTSNETLMERFVSRSRDKKKMTDALLALSHLIPGSHQILAIIEAINIMLGPEETTR